jgi:mRNA-degrading endonuclease RelE of RelBE toxin-antitoxin system
MSGNRRYSIAYAPLVKRHLNAIEKRHYALIQRTIEQQLSYDPHVETRNRKPLKRPAEFDADWELRFGPDNCFRVLYFVDEERGEARVEAIGVKKGSCLRFGNEEVSP